MEISKDCPLGIQNSTRLDNMEVGMQELSQTLKDVNKRLERFIPIWVTLFLMVISGITTGLAVALLTKGV